MICGPKTLVLKPVLTEIGQENEKEVVQLLGMCTSMDGQEMAVPTATLGKCETGLPMMVGDLAVTSK